MIIEHKTKRILSVTIGRGREHDFRVCKRSGCATSLKDQTLLLGDSGYQGVKKFHENSRTPHKRSKKVLTEEQRAFNKGLSRERVVVEQVIRRLKRPCPSGAFYGQEGVSGVEGGVSASAEAVRVEGAFVGGRVQR